MGERERRTGTDLVRAVTLGYDLCCRFHLASSRRYDRLVAVAVGRTCLSRETDQAPDYQVTPGRAAAPSGRHDTRTATTATGRAAWKRANPPSAPSHGRTDAWRPLRKWSRTGCSCNGGTETAEFPSRRSVVPEER
jgi:hypothetical protein